MPRKPTIRRLPLTEYIPRIRCTPIMKSALDSAAKKYGTTATNVARVCIAHVLGITDDPALLEEASRGFMAMVKETELSGCRPDSSEDREDKDEHL